MTLGASPIKVHFLSCECKAQSWKEAKACQGRYGCQKERCHEKRKLTQNISCSRGWKGGSLKGHQLSNKTMDSLHFTTFHASFVLKRRLQPSPFLTLMVFGINQAHNRLFEFLRQNNHVPKYFKRFWKVWQDFRRFHKVFKRFHKVMKGSKRFQKVPKGFKRFWNVLKGSEMFWNVLKCSEMFWKVSKCSEMFLKVPTGFEMFQCFERSQKVPKSSERCRK